MARIGRGFFMATLVVALSASTCESIRPGTSEATWAPKSGLPVTEPAQVRSQGGVLRVTLEAAKRTLVVSGSNLRASPFKIDRADAQLVGPTLRVRPGERIELTFKNNLDQRTNIHYHGLHVSPDGVSDNVFRTFEKGKTYESLVQLPANHPVGTFWYHVHFHGNTQEQVMGGLAGLLIVEGLEEKLPPPYRGITQRQLTLQDVRVDGDSVTTNPNANVTHLVNGLLNPAIPLRQGEVQLWRLANFGPNVIYRQVSLTNSAGQPQPFLIAAEDGNPLFGGKLLPATSLEVPPGKRFDILVQVQAPGSYQVP
jgi:suppressor of ftsI